MEAMTIKQQILGVPDVSTYLAGLFFVFLIAIYKKSWKAKKDRDPGSNRTPEKWNWKFFVADNLRDLFSILVITFLFFRFSSFLITKYFSFMGKEADLMLYAALLGFFSTYIQQGIEILECRWGQWLVKKARSANPDQ